MSNWIKRHKVLTGVLAFIILCVIVSAAGGGNHDKTSNETSGTQTASKPAATDTTQPAATTTPATTQTPAPAAKANKVSQRAAENYCEDAGLLGKYIDTKTTSIVTFSYNPQYIDSGEQATNGDEIWDLQWSGKNKTTGESVGFVCMVSGTDKAIILHDLAINGTAVYGPVDEK